MLDTGKRERKAVNYLAPGVSSAELRGHGGGGPGDSRAESERAQRLPRHLRLPRIKVRTQGVEGWASQENFVRSHLDIQ